MGFVTALVSSLVSVSLFVPEVGFFAELAVMTLLVAVVTALLEEAALAVLVVLLVALVIERYVLAPLYHALTDISPLQNSQSSTVFQSNAVLHINYFI